MSRVPLMRPASLAGIGVFAALLLSSLPDASGEAPAKQDAKATADTAIHVRSTSQGPVLALSF